METAKRDAAFLRPPSRLRILRAGGLGPEDWGWHMERVWVVIPAGGRGQRFGAAQAKQYVLLRDRPVIAHTLAAFLGEPRIAGIQLVLPGEDIATGAWRELLGPMPAPLLPPVVGAPACRFGAPWSGGAAATGRGAVRLGAGA